MLITLFTDASYCHRTRIATYAVWAKSDGRTFRHAGLLKQPTSSSNLAEAMALVNGIHLTLTGLRPPPGSRIIAQTDSQTAIDALTGVIRRTKVVAQFAPMVEAYRQRIEVTGVRVEFRHVRGHKGTVTPRNAVNTWCDEACRRLLRSARLEQMQAA